MKSLILFRHGKSDWDADDGRDHERPVSPRGERAARTMGRLLTLAEQPPDSIVTSSAVRARKSVELAMEAGGWKCSVRVTNALYESTPARVLEEVRTEAQTTGTLLLAGHEPTWSELARQLTGGGKVRFPTACMVRIDFETELWKDVDFGSGEIIWLLPPKFFRRDSFEFAD